MVVRQNARDVFSPIDITHDRTELLLVWTTKYDWLHEIDILMTCPFLDLDQGVFFNWWSCNAYRHRE